MQTLSFHPPVIGIGGAKALAPENTLASFRRATQEGLRWIETDVKLTRDGVPILMHDETLDRTTNGIGPVAMTDWADIQKLDAGSWFAAGFAGERVPHLAEALRYALDNDLHLNLEIKPCLGRSQATAMVTLIETSKVWPRNMPPPLISSFDVDALIVAAQLHPEWPRGFSFEEWPDNLPAIIKMTDPAILALDEKLLTDERLSILKKTNLQLLVSTINDPAKARTLMQEGFTAVFSDDPKPLIEAF